MGGAEQVRTGQITHAHDVFVEMLKHKSNLVHIKIFYLDKKSFS